MRVETLFPTSLPPWQVGWDAEAGAVVLGTAGCGESARILRLDHP